ncbi:MAG: hypothetical protein F6J95_012120 [Leptolyngbya sp. SIO1E4]|nr:hypothetical protein [Leptolyngbya sp. SIO1E4]
MRYSSRHYNLRSEQTQAKVAVYSERMVAGQTFQQQLQELLLLVAAIASVMSAFWILH